MQTDVWLGEVIQAEECGLENVFVQGADATRSSAKIHGYGLH